MFEPNNTEPLIGPRPRVRSGCLTCRRRKVKCDEQRPYCYNCTRLKRPCIYANRSSPSRCRATLQGSTYKPAGNDTAEIYGADTVGSTTPSASVPEQSLSNFAATETETWALPLDFLGTNADLSFQDQSDALGLLRSPLSPMLSWSQMELIDEPSLRSTHSSSPAVNNSSPFLYFLEQVDPPFIANFDDMNWKTMKRYIMEIGCHHTVISQAISAVESIYKATMKSEDTLSSMASYYVAKSGYASMLEQDSDGPENILIVTFLLCCFEIVAQHDTVPITLKPEGPLVARLEAWVSNTAYKWSPIIGRLQAWFQILQAKTVHLGGPGILSPKVSTLLECDRRGSTPILAQSGDQGLCPQQAILSDLSNNLLEFYLEIQLVSTRIACLNRHHRSRGFQEDEREVQTVAEDLQKILRQLWERRPALLRTDREQLRQKLWPGLRSTVGRLVDLCIVAYFAEVIYLGRAYGNCPSAPAESLEAMNHIHHIIDFHCCGQSVVDPGFIWPLFLFAVEHPNAEKSQWAIRTLRLVNNPLWHSEFVSNLAQGICEEQLRQAKRVDTRYFSLKHFSTPPPFI